LQSALGLVTLVVTFSSVEEANLQKIISRMFITFSLTLATLLFINQANAYTVQKPTNIYNMTQLQEKLALAHKERKPVLIEFWASWCPACRQLDRVVLSDPTVQRNLHRVMFLRVDITHRNDNLMAIVGHYQVYGTPTLIFYNHNGQRLHTEAFDDGVSRQTFNDVLLRL
jgi:thiol:disulfide interchange protein